MFPTGKRGTFQPGKVVLCKVVESSIHLKRVPDMLSSLVVITDQPIVSRDIRSSQSSSWKKVGPVACGGAVEGPASAMSISSWVYEASCDIIPVIC